MIEEEAHDREDAGSQAKPLAIPEGWTKVPDLTALKEDLTSAASIQEEGVIKIDNWLDHLNITGPVKRKAVPGRSSVQPKLIRKQAEWRYSSLSDPFLSTEDIFNVSPRTHLDKLAADQNGLVLNYQFNTQMNKRMFIDDFIHTLVDEGTVIVKTGWDYRDKLVMEDVPMYEYVTTLDPKVAQLHEDIVIKSQEDPAYIQSLPEPIAIAHGLTVQKGEVYVPKLKSTESVEVVKVLSDRPTVEVCNYRNIVVDPTCQGDLTKANFIIYSFETSKSELKKSGKYTNLDAIVAESATVLADPEHDESFDGSFTFKDDARKVLVAYEYWGFREVDSSGMTQAVLFTWVGNTLIQAENNPFPHQKLPFVKAQYMPKRRELLGEPDGELLMENQAIVGAVTRGMVDVMGRSAAGQQGMRMDALDVVNKRRYKKGDDYEFNPNVNPNDMVHAHQYPELPRSTELMLNYQHAEAESLTGIKAFAGGISGEALGDSVGGIRSVLDATAMRGSSILGRAAEAIKEIGLQFISMNSVFLSDETVVRITDEEFVTVKPENLKGDFDLKMAISSAEADNAQATELAFMLQTTGQSMGQEFSQIILSEIATLRKMPVLAKKIEMFKPQPDPLQQRIQQLEIMKLEKEIGVLDADAMEKRSKALLNSAKAGTEQVVAGNTQSDKDMKDLNFLEQQEGVTQERELEKQKAQSEGNINLEVVKHALAPKETKKAT